MKSGISDTQGVRLERPERVTGRVTFRETFRNEHNVCGVLTHARGTSQAAWSPEGRLLSERHFDKRGVATGLEIQRHDDGRPEWRVPWRGGQMHGWAIQFDEKGRVLVRSRFVHGTGIDVWVSGGVVTKIRHMVLSQPHGLERWGHPRFPTDEGHWLDGRRAGVFRRWDGDALEVGFPKFFVADDEVTLAEYRRRRRRDRRLPEYDVTGNVRERSDVSMLQDVRLRASVRRRLEDAFGSPKTERPRLPQRR